MERSPLIVSIGTVHPWGIAGVGLDAHVACDYRFRHAMAVAAVSAQDEHGVRALHAIPAAMLRAQMESLPDDVRAFRIGALVSAENAAAVAEYLDERARHLPAVLDPVLGATLGGSLAHDDLLPTIRERLLPLPMVMTPNILEAQRLLQQRVENLVDMEAAARAFVDLGARAALVTGGHLPGDPADVLATRDRVQIFRAHRLPGEMRGTGCTLAAALACELARGTQLETAVEIARAYVREKIAEGRSCRS